MNVLITGSNGFIGSALVNLFVNKGMRVSSLSRKITSKKIEKNIVINDLENLKDKSSTCYEKIEQSLTGQDVIVHTAARVHIMNETESSPLDAFLNMNCKTTLSLAELAAAKGVKRFIYISTINVYGLKTESGMALKYNDQINPSTPYAVSKYEAEKGLTEIAKNTGMEVVIIRSPLVYGANVPANFGALLKLVSKQWPLPFGSISNNKRSFIGLENLVDLIFVCSTSKSAANQMFLASDNNDLSCRELFEKISFAFGYKAKLLPIPLFLFTLLGKVTGKKRTIDSLCASFQVNIDYTCETLNWKPRVTVDEGMKQAASYFKLNHDN